MSHKGSQWAKDVRTGRSSYRFILAVLGDTHHEKNDTCYASVEYLHDCTEQNKKTLRAGLAWLTEEGFISERPGNGSAKNYQLHFDQLVPKNGMASKAGNTANLMQGDTPPPSKIGTGDGPPKNGSGASQNSPGTLPLLGDKQGKRELNGDSPPTPSPNELADKVIDYLNRKAGKRFGHTEGNRKFIRARLEEGRTAHDFKRVIDNRVMRWGGTERAEFLRPSTLFRPTNFENYLNDNGETGQGAGYSAERTEALIGSVFGDGLDVDPFALPPGGED